MATTPKNRYFLFLVELTSGRVLTPQYGTSLPIAKNKLSKRADFVRILEIQQISERQYHKANTACPTLPRCILKPAVTRR